jgi:putative chitinase
LSQIAVESNQLKSVKESLYYKKSGQLKKTFGEKYFSEAEDEEPYLENEEDTANFVYANKLGNGDEESGDGWKYKGRGLIQVTGKDNYEVVGENLGIDLVNHPEILEQPEYAVASATDYWEDRDINSVADKTTNADDENFKKVTKKVNAKLLNLKERQEFFRRALTCAK